MPQLLFVLQTCAGKCYDALDQSRPHGVHVYETSENGSKRFASQYVLVLLTVDMFNEGQIRKLK